MPDAGAVRSAHWLRIPLRRPLHTAVATVTHRVVTLIRHRSADGAVGWGEYAPWPAPPPGAVDAVAAACATGRTDDLVLHAALAAAAADADARARGLRLAEVLADGATLSMATVPVNALVDAAAGADAAVAAVAAGFGTLKCKVGVRSADEDVAFVQALRGAVGDDVRIRLDANRAWDVPTAVDVLGRIEDCGVEFVEQPVAGFDALAEVRARTAVPVAVDEDLRSPGDLAHCLQAGAADVVVCKPAVLGGPAATVAVARAAAAVGTGVVVAGMIDSTVGLATALAVAAVAPTTGAAGLGTADLLADDVTAPLRPTDGTLALPDAPGIGVTPDPDALERLAFDPTDLR